MVLLQRWSCLIERENGNVRGVDSFMDGRMVMLRRWPVSKARELSCYRGGQFNGGMNDHVTDLVTLLGGRIVMLQKVATLMEGECSCYGCG